MTDYITKDSGKREEYATGMRRDTQEGKALFSLLRPKDVPYDEQFMTRCAMLMTRGAEKYGLRNWEKAHTQQELDRFLDSAERHMQQYLSGDRSEDHGAAVFFNLLAAETVRYKMSIDWHSDDCECRPAPEPEPSPLKIEGLSINITPPKLADLVKPLDLYSNVAAVPVYHQHTNPQGRDYIAMEDENHRELVPHAHSGGTIFAADYGPLVDSMKHFAP